MGSRSVFVGSQFCNAYKTWEKCGKLLRPLGPIIILLPLRHPNGAQFSSPQAFPPQSPHAQTHSRIFMATLWLCVLNSSKPLTRVCTFQKKEEAPLPLALLSTGGNQLPPKTHFRKLVPRAAWHPIDALLPHGSSFFCVAIIACQC